MKLSRNLYLKIIFLAIGASVAAFFVCYSLIYEFMVKQMHFDVVVSIRSDREFKLISSLNHISDEGGRQFRTHEINKGETELRIPFPDDDVIEKIYFNTDPRLIEFEINRMFLDYPFMAYSMEANELINCVSTGGYAYEYASHYAILHDHSLKVNFDKEMAVFVIGEGFFKPLYNKLMWQRLLIAFPIALIVLFVGFFRLKKVKMIEKIPGYQLSFTVFFVLILFVPFISQKEVHSGENRTLAKFPDLNQLVWRIPDKYNDYFNDHFPFRNSLGKLNNYMKIGIFNISPMPNHVRIGKDGWLFNYIPDVRPYVLDDDLYTKEELKIIERSLLEKRDWLAMKGIDFYFMLTPFKHELYLEELPSIMKKRSGKWKRQQLLEHLRTNTNLKLIDPFDRIAELKDSIDVFFKNDIHWNQLGAFMGYREMILALAKDYPEIKPFKLSDYSIEVDTTFEGDLMHLMNLDAFFPTASFNMMPKYERHAIEYRNRPFVEKELNYHYFESDQGIDKRFLLIRDSYARTWLPILSEHFKQSSFSWNTTVLPDRIEQDKPEIVVLEMMEMYGIWLRIKNEPEILRDLGKAEN